MTDALEKQRFDIGGPSSDECASPSGRGLRHRAMNSAPCYHRRACRGCSSVPAEYRAVARWRSCGTFSGRCYLCHCSFCGPGFFRGTDRPTVCATTRLRSLNVHGSYPGHRHRSQFDARHQCWTVSPSTAFRRPFSTPCSTSVDTCYYWLAQGYPRPVPTAPRLATPQCPPEPS